MLGQKMAVTDTVPECRCSCGEVFLREQRNFCVRCGRIISDKDIHEDASTIMTTRV